MADPEYDDLFADEEETAAPPAAEEETAPAKTAVTGTFEEEPRQRVETPIEEQTKTRIGATYEDEPAPRKRATRTPAPKTPTAPKQEKIVTPEPQPEQQTTERRLVRIRVTDDSGIVIAGRTFVRGQVIELYTDSPQYRETVGADGKSWLDLADDPQAQRLRWKRETPLIEPVRG